MADFFAALILILMLAFVLAAAVAGALILFALVYGVVMAFVGWLRH